MPHEPTRLSDPAKWLAEHQPDVPVMFFDPGALARTATRFLQGFPGEVTYAVKSNPDVAVVSLLHKAGMQAFDVASPAEMDMVRKAAPRARLHYHNPIRSLDEIATARAHGITSWSVDRLHELEKLGDITNDEIAVRLHLPVPGAAYDFGAKFGAPPERAVALLQEVERRGGRASLTFHPGTQCTTPEPWRHYLAGAAQVARQSGVRLLRLNVGGGFPSQRDLDAPDLEAIFELIASETRAQFGADHPALVCEPGRGLVGDCMTLALRIKSLEARALYLNDGIYGALAEWRDIGAGGRIAAMSPHGKLRNGEAMPRAIWGPTCDSLDALPEPLALPCDLHEGDYLVIAGMGAYAATLVTGFNGYGTRRIVRLPMADAAALPMDTAAETPSLARNTQVKGAGPWKNSETASRSRGSRMSAS